MFREVAARRLVQVWRSDLVQFVLQSLEKDPFMPVFLVQSFKNFTELICELDRDSA